MFSIDTHISFIAPNAEQFTDYVMSLDHNMINNDVFGWGDKCKVDRIPISKYNVQDLIKPSIDYLRDLKNEKPQFKYELVDTPWVNLYNVGGFQELHEHYENDFVCVFFANSGANFSKFFFFDWNTGISTPMMPDPGTIMFFSSKRTHGVSLHNSEIVRRTLSCNFNIRAHHQH